MARRAARPRRAGARGADAALARAGTARPRALRVLRRVACDRARRRARAERAPLRATRRARDAARQRPARARAGSGAFLGERRLAVVAAHLEALRPGGLALLGVPNRYGVVYRLWKGALTRTGSWPLGTEEPFSAAEIAAMAARAGGRPLEPVFGSFAASVVNHGVNQALFKLGRRGLPLPELRLPVLDRFAYELLLPVVKPE